MSVSVVESGKLVAAAPYLIEQDWNAYTPERDAHGRCRVGG